MSATLLCSGKTEHFRALGETGQPVYHSALQLRKVISRRLPGKERHLAIPQRDQQGEGVDWYSSIVGDVIPWSSATEGEREDARIQLAAFRQEVVALNQMSPEGLGGDHEVFAQLVKWVCHFPDENFVYLVDGTPVITFWGFIHPDTDRHANPLLCLYPPAAPHIIQPASSTVAPILSEPTSPLEPQPRSIAPVQPWWRRWWWLLPLVLALGLLLFGLRACTSPDALTLSTPSLEMSAPNASLPESVWQGWDVWPFNRWGDGSLSAPNLTSPDLVSPRLNGSLVSAIGSNNPPTMGADAAGDLPSLAEMPNSNGMATTLPLPENVAPADPPAEGMAALPTDMPAVRSVMAPPSLEPLTLPANAPDGTATFLNGNWRGAGVMDSQTGRPLQVTYSFDQGEGIMYIQRGGSGGMTCAGPVSANMRNGQLQMEAQERARCEDGNYYEMPHVQCHQPDGESASCAASYDDEPFPMQLRKASEQDN